MMQMTRFEALCAVRAAFKTQQEMADAFDVVQGTISLWLNQSKQLPAQHVLKAEMLTGVSRHDLRPDIYPREVHPAGFVGIDRGTHRVAFNRQLGIQGVSS